jgi:hypothetical protein
MKRISTRLYRSSHGHEPRGRGLWIFEQYVPGQPPTDITVTRTGTYTEARRALPAGEWVVLP